MINFRLFTNFVLDLNDKGMYLFFVFILKLILQKKIKYFDLFKLIYPFT